MISTSPSITTNAPSTGSASTEKVATRDRLLSLPWFRLAVALGAILLAASIPFSFWSLTLHAPQYPDGLEVTVFIREVTGDVREVDGLNHYIGMMPLGEAAEFERSIATVAIALFVVLGAVAAILKTRWTPLLALPIVLFPFVFAADLYFWLYRAGHNLDPTAALSSSIKPFTPAILGEGIVGQFSTTAMFGPGWFMSLAAAIVTAIGIVGLLRRRSSHAAA